MITIRQFVGALLEEVTKARAISDAASVQIAQKYLDHPFLKGFPVPRMHVREMELDLCFAVAARVRGVSALESDEVRLNVRHQVRAFLEAIPNAPELSPYFVEHPLLLADWKGGLDGVDARIEAALTRESADRDAVARAISVVIENYMFEVARGGDHPNFISSILRVFRTTPTQSSDAPPNVNEFIFDHVRTILGGVDSAGAEAEALSDLLDLNVLVGAAELEKLSPQHLQKMKLKFTAADRKWVVSDTGDGKTATLARS